jgi:hypothetical protein
VFQVFFNSLCKPGPEVALNRISYYRSTSQNKRKEKNPFTIPFLSPHLCIALIVQWRSSQLRVNSTPYSEPNIIKEGEEPRKAGRSRKLHSATVVPGKAGTGGHQSTPASEQEVATKKGTFRGYDRRCSIGVLRGSEQIRTDWR